MLFVRRKTESFLLLLPKGRLETQTAADHKNGRVQTTFLGDPRTQLTSGGEVVAAEWRGVALHGVEA